MCFQTVRLNNPSNHDYDSSKNRSYFRFNQKREGVREKSFKFEPSSFEFTEITSLTYSSIKCCFSTKLTSCPSKKPSVRFFKA